jgi:signal transduction histidine kinase
MTIRAKIIGCFVFIVLLFSAVSVHNYFRFRQANARLILVNEFYLPYSRLIVQLQGSVFSLAEDIRRFHFQRDTGSEFSNLSRMVRDLYPYLVAKRIVSMETLLQKQTDPEIVTLSGEYLKRTVRIKQLLEEMSSLAGKETFERKYEELRGEIQTISKSVDEECQRITLAAQSEGKENLIASLAIISLVALLGFLSLLLSNNVLKPLPQLIQSVKKIADGDFNQSLKLKSSTHDEVSVLAREYNRMLSALSERDHKISDQQKELLQSERLAAVGQLSAEVVHEIRNPLNSISLNIDWLQSELTTADEEIRKTLVSISREIERLHQITESYLVRARMPTQESQKVRLNELLSEILDFSKEEDKARNIEVKREFSSNEIFIRSDRSRLKQALINILKNAREAMPGGGRLVVKSEQKGNISRVLIRDSGYGMNETTRIKTFQPFYSTKQNGTGLGLTLTKTIIEEAQGSIHCESQMGEGTTFTLQFPV